MHRDFWENLENFYLGTSTPFFCQLFTEYIEDICPYATFQLTKPSAYSESSYSGNVYSGPYHSVRGSFVYHDLKQNDKYKVGHQYHCMHARIFIYA